MKEIIQQRSKEVSLAIINMVEMLPSKIAALHIAKQIIRSSTSVAANCRIACQTGTSKEYIDKLQIVIEEAGETLFWLEIIRENKWCSPNQIDKVYKEMTDLLSVFISSAKSVKNTMRVIT